MDIQKLLWAILRGWWIIVAFALISAGIGLAFSYRQQPIYEVDTSFVINPNPDINGTYDRLYSIDTLAGRTALATTYSELVQSIHLAENATAKLGVPASMLEEYERSCVALPDSFVLKLHITGPSPDLAADLANEIAAGAIAYVKSLQEMYELRQVDMAVANPEPISPDHVQNTVLSTIIGVAGGIGFSILREALLQFFGESRVAKKEEQEEEQEEEQGKKREKDISPVPRPIP
jgi:uncharacterized protein involved in exopolysaccharide biosynthesis